MASAKEVAPLVEQALEQGCDPNEILNEGLISAMSIIGDKFSANEIFVPEMLVAARAMSAGTKVLKPYLSEAGAEPLGKAVIGTVQGDMHDIGKNLVRMMIEGKGFEVEDLGVDVSPRAVRRLHSEQRCRHRLPVLAADHHHAQHRRDHQGHRGGRAA